MVFASNQEKNESYNFKDMFLQPDKSDFILSTIKEAGSHETKSHWTLMKNSEVNNKHKYKDGKLKNILSIWYFKHNRSPCGILTKHNARLCVHGRIQKWVRRKDLTI